MSQKRAFAAKVLAEIAANQQYGASERTVAASALAQMEDYLAEETRWYHVNTRDLTLFFLKCVLAAAPAALVVIFMWIFIAIFVQVVPTLMGVGVQ